MKVKMCCGILINNSTPFAKLLTNYIIYDHMYNIYGWIIYINYHQARSTMLGFALCFGALMCLPFRRLESSA